MVVLWQARFTHDWEAVGSFLDAILTIFQENLPLRKKIVIWENCLICLVKKIGKMDSNPFPSNFNDHADNFIVFDNY